MKVLIKCLSIYCFQEADESDNGESTPAVNKPLPKPSTNTAPQGLTATLTAKDRRKPFFKKVF